MPGSVQGVDPDRHTGPMQEATRVDIERWLTRRGTPHLIDDYSASRDVLTRALPFLTFLFVLATLGAINDEWAWGANLLAVIGGLGILVGAWAITNRLRGRRWLQRPDRVGVVELSVFVLVPPLLPAIFGGQVDNALNVILGNLILLGLVYIGTSYGLVPMTRWALGRLFRQLGETLALFTRGLPLLLLALVFLFINAEVWQVAASLEPEWLWSVVALFFVFGALFIITRLPRELAPLARFDTSDQVDRLVGDSPAAHLRLTDVAAIPPLSRREWGNVALVVLVTQGFRIILASVLMGGFLVVFGLLIMDPDTITSWTQSPINELSRTTVFERDVVVTRELLRVAVFLAAFSGFYFTVHLVTDPTFREEFFEDVEEEIRESFAVRAVYREAIADTTS